MILRSLLLAFFAVCLCASPLYAAANNPPSIEVWKSATCECCGNWVKHLEANGFAVKVNATEPAALERLRAQAGIVRKLAACHTAKIGDYVIEGHVPATDIKRVVVERPEAIGLPGMPAGSPGMEQGGESEAYNVLLVNKDGTTKVLQATEPLAWIF